MDKTIETKIEKYIEEINSKLKKEGVDFKAINIQFMPKDKLQPLHTGNDFKCYVSSGGWCCGWGCN